WRYVNRFSSWMPYEHRVVAHVEEKTVPVPVNQTTLNTLFGADIRSEADAKEWFEANRELIPDPSNAKEAVLARMGKQLYELLFKGYTTKQWGVEPALLGAEVTNRIPIRYDDDDRYFTDVYQALPVHGYTKLFEKMANSENIEVLLNTE